MKKIILLLCVSVFILTSCSSDDDNEDLSQDQLIGTWTYFQSFEDGVEIILTDCEKQETQEFSSNGDFTITFYDDFDGPCEEDFVLSGTWSNSGNNLYTIEALGQTISQELVFEGDTYSVTETDTDGGETIVYREVYIRN